MKIAGENKVYSEFFTNLAVAWFAGGIITPLFVRVDNLWQTSVFAVWGISGTYISLKLAILSLRKEKL